MTDAGKHRRAGRVGHRGRSESRRTKRAGLIGAAMVGSGLALAYSMGSAPSNGLSDLSQASVPHAADVASSRDLDRTPLESVVVPAASDPSSTRPPVLGPVVPAAVTSAAASTGGQSASSAQDVSAAIAVPPVLTAAVAPVLQTPAVVTAIDASAISRAQQIGHLTNWAHLCLGFVRSMFGLETKEPSAAAAWNAAQYKHVGDSNPPAGVPVFWSGGSTGAGHVAYSLGNGVVLSTDLPAAGYVSEVPISYVQAKWGLTYLGWTEDLEGVRVYGR